MPGWTWPQNAKKHGSSGSQTEAPATDPLDVKLNRQTARIVPLGLIVAELVTNAAKHGAGEIKVAFGHAAPGGYALSVSDQGAGLPAGYDPAATGGLGMRVISTLVGQLRGRLAFASGHGRGTEFTVLFPASD